LAQDATRTAAPIQLQARLVPEKSVYYPHSPVTLRLVINNFSGDPIELQMPRLPFAEMLTFEEGDKFKTPLLLFPRPKSARPAEKIIAEVPRGGALRIEGGAAVVVSLNLSNFFSFDEAGDYSAVLKLPPISARVKGEKRTWSPTIKGVIKVAATPAPEKVNASIELIAAEQSDSGIPTLKWTMKPPAREKLPLPNIYDGNCRIIIRDEKDKLVQEQFLILSGQRQGGEWKQPLEWKVPLTLRTFGVVGNMFPRAGVYQVEATYRTYIGADGLQKLSPHPVEIEVNDFYTSEKMIEAHLSKPAEMRSLPHKAREFRPAQPSDSTPAEGRWITFTKTFKLEISEELWKKFDETEAQREKPEKLPPPPPIGR
jgi:hypothetical protein